MDKHPFSICVFCGSSSGNHPQWAASARILGKAVAQRRWRLIYGGGKIGLMGELADAALEANGEVIGVLNHRLAEKEIAHQGLTKLLLVKTLLERKQQMMQLANAFIILPGGVGTLDELFEAFIWLILGEHQKPCMLINTNGYWNELLGFLQQVSIHGFLKPKHLNQLKIYTTPQQALTALTSLAQQHIDSPT